jgi:integrase/recombinase XerD
VQTDIIPSQASSDDQLIEMWLHDRPSGTQTNYRSTIKDFRQFTAKPLQHVTLEDLQRYTGHLSERGLKDATRRNKINAVKSLFTFASKLQYVRFNVAAALRLKPGKRTLAGRILRKDQVRQLLQHPFLLLMYATGARVSELCALTWESFQVRDGGVVQVRILGKGDKERVVIVPQPVWAIVAGLRGDRPIDAPVFWHNGRPMNRFDAYRLVKSAATEAGLSEKISPHWLRHAHCQHSLAGGAPLHLVRDSLGHSSIAVTDIYLHSMPEDSSSKYLGI